MARTVPSRGCSASTRTPTSIEVRQAALTEAVKVTSSPMWIGSWNVIRSMPAVTTRRRECRTAARPGDLVAELHHRAAVDEAGRVGVDDPHPAHEHRVRVGGFTRAWHGMGTLAVPDADPEGREAFRGRHGRTHVRRHQVEDQQAPRQGRGPLGDPRVQLPEADGAAAERQEGHRGRRHVQEAPPAAAAEARAAGRQARHAGAPGARAEPRGPRPHRARAQAVRADRAAVARPAGRRARDPAGPADRQGAEAALEARAVPDQEGGHQGPVLRRGGPGQDLRGGDGRGRGDGRRRARDAARAGQDREHARPRRRDGGARGRRRVRRQPPARLGRRRHRPPAARADLPERRRRRPREDEGRARRGLRPRAGPARRGRAESAPSEERPS